MNLTEHRERVEQAQRILAEGRKALLRPDGSRMYSDAEHVERDHALLATYNQTLAEASQAAQAAIHEADALLSRPDADPLSSLSASELERANALLLFTERDAELLSLQELAGRMELALEGDKATRYVWWRAADRLVRQWKNGVRNGIAPTDTAGRKAAATVTSLHTRLLGSLVDLEAHRRAEEEARARQSQAVGVMGRAVVESYVQRTYGPRPATVNGG